MGSTLKILSPRINDVVYHIHPPRHQAANTYMHRNKSRVSYRTPLPPFTTSHPPYNPFPPGATPGVKISPAPSRAFISFSCSTICCSSTSAIANGTISISAPVDSTQIPLPPNQAPVFTALVVVWRDCARKRRVRGGMMSWRARMLKEGGWC